MSENQVEVVNVDGKVIFSPGGEEGDQEWFAAKLMSGDYLLSPRQAADGGGHPEGVGYCGVETLYDLLRGFLSRGWTGSVSIDTGWGRKKIFIEKGAISFAASDLIDDRLGEVIYQQGKINLDQFMDSATQVTRKKRFGQVLLQSQVFDHFGLLGALKEQVKFILSSIFMFEHVRFSFETGVTSRLGLGFLEDRLDVLDACYGAGSIYQSFIARLSDEADISLSEHARKLMMSGPGTFFCDFLALLDEHKVVSELIVASKLQPHNTKAILMRLCKAGYCQISGLLKAPAISSSQGLWEVVDRYNSLAVRLSEACGKHGDKFPIKDLVKTVATLNSVGFGGLMLDSGGSLTTESLGDIVTICSKVERATAIYEKKITYLSRYLVQLFSDQLPHLDARI